MVKKGQIKNILGLGSSNTENYNNNEFSSYLQILRRKYELEEKHVYKLCDKQIKNCSKQLKK